MKSINFVDLFYIVLPFGDHRNSSHRSEARRLIKQGLDVLQQRSVKIILFDKQHRGYTTFPKEKHQ